MYKPIHKARDKIEDNAKILSQNIQTIKGKAVIFFSVFFFSKEYRKKRKDKERRGKKEREKERKEDRFKT